MNSRSVVLSVFVLLALSISVPFVVDAVAVNEVNSLAAQEKIKVTVPNGGEQWEVGTTNSILWTPYGYDPNINPSGDVEAYLEKKIGPLYFPAGKIVPSGKASIHWEGDIDAHGKYPSPGNYVIRIKNIKTGETDRSDRVFTLTSRSIDLKVNKSNGPLTLKSGAEVTLAWAPTKGKFKTCNAYGVTKELKDGEDWYETITDLPAKGTLKAYVLPQAENISISCEREDGEWRYDSVQVKIANVPVTATSSVQVLSPNGSSAQVVNNQLEIFYSAVDVRSVSIALYKNNKLFQWIVKDTVPEAYAKGKYQHVWQVDSALAQELQDEEQVFKIYITGKNKNNKGYVDDKSDEFFRFFVNTSPEGEIKPPFCVLTTTDTEIVAGDSVTIRWTSELADYAVLPGGDKGPANGSETYYPEVTKTYTYTFVGPGGKTNCSKTITVDDAGTDQISIVDFKVSPNTIFSKQAVTLSWTTENVTSCKLTQSKSGTTSVATNGSKSVTIADTTTFKLQCKNGSMSVEDSVTVMKAEYNTGTTPTTVPTTNTPAQTETEAKKQNLCSTKGFACQIEASVGVVVENVKKFFGW